MEQVGIVKECDGGWASVVIVRGTSCGDTCGACTLCGNRENVVRVLNPIGAQTGSQVRVVMPSGSVLIMAFAAYILPIIMTIVAYFALGLFLDGGARDTGTLLCLVIFILLVSKRGSKLFKGERFQSRITSVIKEADEA